MTRPCRTSGSVVIVGQAPPPIHGSTLVCQELIGVLGNSGIDIELVDKNFSSTIAEIGKPNARKIARVPGLLSTVIARTSGHTRAIIYFISLSPGAFLVDAINIAAIARLRHAPLVLYIHGRGFRELASRGSLWSRTVARTLSAADVCVTLSPSLEEDIAPWVHPNRRRVISNPVPGGDPGPQLFRGGCNFLFLSNLVREKGPDVFLEAASILANTNLDPTFTLAGSPFDPALVDDLERIASQPNLQGRVEFSGSVDHAQKTQLFAACSVLVFPSRYQFEASPLTILEAKRAGRGVIASSQGGIPDMVRDGVDGHLLSDSTPECLAKAMGAMVEEPKLAAMWGVAARQDYENAYTNSTFRANWLGLLNSLTDVDPGSRGA